jgi:hypothetical protein
MAKVKVKIILRLLSVQPLRVGIACGEDDGDGHSLKNMAFIERSQF